MKCPRCQRPVDQEADSCYSCGYSAFDAMKQYGDNYVRMSRVHDAAHCLRVKDRERLNEVVDQLELRFPQILFCVYLGALPDSISISELGFWLLNHSQVKGAEYARPNDNAVLLVLDVNSKQAGLSLGYFTEMLISEEDAYRCLMAARPGLINQEYGSAIATVFGKVGRILGKKARKLRGLSPDELKDQFSSPGIQIMEGSAA